MFRLTFRNLHANKLRLGLTAFAVVLGVSFVVSSFVLTDGLRESFGSLSEEIAAGTDLEIRPGADFDTQTPLDDASVDLVGAIDGVEAAVGGVQSESVIPIQADGTPMATAGPPLLGVSWVDDPTLSSFTVVEGRAPSTGFEFTIDETSAAEGDFVVGETYAVTTQAGRFDLELVGTTRFGEENATLGVVLTQYPIDTAREMLAKPDTFDSIVVRFADGADANEVEARIAAALPVGVELLDQAELVEDNSAEFEQGIDILNNVLLGFAIVALFVSVFIIANTFAIVFGQRTKELALLRAIGASGRQIRLSTMGEAFVVGVISSALGIAGGVGLAAGLGALFDALGAELPDSPVQLATRTVIAAFAVGVGVTMASAFGPARRAGRIAPMAALADRVDAPGASDRRRLTTGAVLFSSGVAAGAFGLFGSPGSTPALLAALGGGAVLVFLGFALLSATAAGPVISLLGFPLRLFGTTGRLSTGNAVRNPRRTASTAASLMVGLALVTTALVVGESFKRGVADTLQSDVTADFVSSFGVGIDPEVANGLAAAGPFAAAAGYRYDEIRIGDDEMEVMGTDLVATGQLFELDLESGSLSADADTLVVHESEATARNLQVGDAVEVTFPSGVVDTLTVGAIFTSQSIIDADWLVNTAEWTQRFGPPADEWVAARMTPEAELADALAELDAVTATYPQITFEDRSQYQASIESEIDQLLVAINAMLVLAVVIALVGIANTLALSVFERTREVGLLRAVGMTRLQTRRMVRWEAVLVALFGSVLGVALGLGFGWAATTALSDDLIGTTTIPTGRIALLVAVCATSGLVAAAFPARRAARLDVLGAIGQA